MIRITTFQVVHFNEQSVLEENKLPVVKNVLLLYALGENGIVYEMTGGKWLALPVEESKLKTLEELNNAR